MNPELRAAIFEDLADVIEDAILAGAFDQAVAERVTAMRTSRIGRRAGREGQLDRYRPRRAPQSNP